MAIIHQNIFVISILILFFISSTISSAERCHPDDKKALLQIKRAFNNAGMLATLKPDTDCCEWYVVECDETTNRVHKLSITKETEVAGRIPDAVGDLPYLEYLYLNTLPNLIGPLPQSLAKLKKLKTLTISYTNITGPIPEFLSKLTNLFLIDLSYNKLIGSIPSSFANLPILQNIFSFGDIESSYLDLSHNKLTGDASIIFGKNKGFYSINLSRNKFTFDMSKVEISKKLNYLDLSYNKIYGNLPKSLPISHLLTLNVSYNQLCGEIPHAEFSPFDEWSYIHNKCLCGVPLAPCKKLGNNI